jgi:hypothetical protein
VNVSTVWPRPPDPPWIQPTRSESTRSIEATRAALFVAGMKRHRVSQRPGFRRDAMGRVALAVIAQAIEDLRSEAPGIRNDARQFLSGQEVYPWCVLAGVAVGRVHDRVAALTTSPLGRGLVPSIADEGAA